ncbi:MAG: hypothetical protein EBR02_02310 [Alphaproteobacteria bacterium]|nr:hypothetical protein [Alphaproteobacteria bacterium]
MTHQYEPDEILSNLERAISEETLYTPEPLPADKWLQKSFLQKSIRRGETERAVQAASSLWYTDKKKLWGRLHIIALEDIGVASTDTVVQVLTITASSVWRRKMGDLRVALFVTRLLSEAVKSRLADAVFIQAERATKYSGLREHLSKADDNTLADYVTDVSKTLVERSIAVWLLASTNKYPSDCMPQRTGSLDTAISVLRTLDTPKELLEACIGATKLTPWPLALFIPFIQQEVQQHRHRIEHHELPIVSDVDGIPMYACDTFTRIGKSCYRQLQRDVLELRAYSTQQIGLAMFYLEGGLVNKELTAPRLEAIQLVSQITDVELPVPQYEYLRDCLTCNMEVLTAIRRAQLQRHFAGLPKSDMGA